MTSDLIAFLNARLDEAEATALREVAAKREIIRVCGRVYVLRFLAAVYSDHPDYRQEWIRADEASTGLNGGETK